MKALSLWQPWATLIAIGAKQYETRSWATKYRGALLIHAAKSNEGLEFLPYPYFRSALADQHWHTINDIPRGVALCVVNLVDVLPTSGAFVRHLSEPEKAFGNFGPGRFAWKLEVMQVFDKPISMRGKQGLFDCEPPESGEGADADGEA